jgi:hypothetical protein
VSALADPHPRDREVIHELPRYKRLAKRYQDWDVIVERCRNLALRLAGAI